MEILKQFKEHDAVESKDFPKIVFSNLYKGVIRNFYFEIEINNNKFLFSPLYTLLKGEKNSDLVEFMAQNENFFDNLKEYIFTSLFIYSAIIEENCYYLTKPQSILIGRIIHRKESHFELKFYSHYQEELLHNYKDKLYVGRDFIDLNCFERKHFGLKNNFQSLLEQNKKIQERAKHKLRYYSDYKKPYLDEIRYLTNEMVKEGLGRIKIFPQTRVSLIPKVDLDLVLDSILYIHNLMFELQDFTLEFENKLRLREENNFVNYLTKFSKDLIDDIRYLRKISFHIHLRISNFEIK